MLIRACEQKDPGVALSLQQAIEAAAMAVEPAPDENSVLVFSTTMGFKPDAVLSLANSAAIYDSVRSFFRSFSQHPLTSLPADLLEVSARLP